MRLESIQIGRYRSLYEVELQPADLTVLVGPNNGGKTNLVEAIEFLADAYRYGLEIAITRKGGIENIAFRRMRRTKSPTSFKVSTLISLSEMPRIYVSARSRRRATGLLDRTDQIRVSHSFSFRALSEAIEAPFAISAEELTASTVDENPVELLRVRRVGRALEVTAREASADPELQDLLYPFTERGLVDRMEKGLDDTSLITGPGMFSPILSAMTRGVASTRLYQLAPIEGRRSGVPTPNPELDIHGQNLPAFVAQVKRRGDKDWGALLGAMRRVIPELTDIQTRFTPDRRLTLEFAEAGVGRPWSVEEVSDGTIQSLALFAVVQESTSELALIEEPENALHPWIVRNFVDACREVTGKQILLTSHSPALIGYLRPEEITLVWRAGGRTEVKALTEADPSVLEMWQSGEISTFEMLDSGYLPQVVPGGAAE